MEQRNEEKVRLKSLKLSRLKIMYASAVSRGSRSQLLMTPKVILEYNGEQYSVLDKWVMFRFLKYLEPEWSREMHENTMSIKPMHEVLDDFFQEYKTKDVLCWVNQENEIRGVAKTLEEYNEIESVYSYIEERLWNGAGKIERQSFVINEPHFRVRNGNMVVEIISGGDTVKVRGRYDLGMGFVQIIDPKIFKGSIGLLNAEKFYGFIDEVINKLISVDKKAIWDDKETQAVIDTSNMKSKEQDAIERAWFCNSFC